jgi:hypothetical protein
MIQPERQSAKAQSESIVPDGGIVKLPLVSMPNNSSIKWKRGTNALFHYVAYAYISPCQHESAEIHNCNESHCCGKNHDRDAELQRKTKMLEELFSKTKLSDQEKKKNREDAYREPENHEKKPVRTLIANSKDNDESPFQLRIGYKFAVTAMEICIKTMKVGEKARFLCMPQYCEVFKVHVGIYPIRSCNEARKVKQRTAKGWETSDCLFWMQCSFGA